MDMGAIVDESQRKSIEEYVEEARKEGAEVECRAENINGLTCKLTDKNSCPELKEHGKKNLQSSSIKFSLIK